MKKVLKVATGMSFLLSIVSCSIFLGPPGPKLYDNIVLEIYSDNAILIPRTLDKEFMRTVRERLKDATEVEVESQGDLKVVSSCETRTLKVIQDIASVSMASYSETTAGVLRSSATTKRNDDVNITIKTTVIDCESSKKLAIFSYPNSGADPAAVLQKLASWNIAYTYGYQRGPRQRQ